MKSPFLNEDHFKLKEQARVFAENEIRPLARELDEQE
jgi:hypothetical protein